MTPRLQGRSELFLLVSPRLMDGLDSLTTPRVQLIRKAAQAEIGAE